MRQSVSCRVVAAGGVSSVEEVAVKHFTLVPEAPTAINPEIPPEMEEITLKAMQPELEERYHTIDDMLADLEDFRKGQTASISTVVQKALADGSMDKFVAEANEQAAGDIYEGLLED